MRSRYAIAFLLIAGASAAGIGMAPTRVTAESAMAATRAEAPEIVRKRVHLMKENGKHLKELVKAVKAGRVGEQAVENAKAIHDNAQKLPDLFPEGTSSKEVRSRAKPVIWIDQADFRKHEDELVQASAKLIDAAQSGKAAVLGPAVKATADVCSACHKRFRGPKLK